MHAEVRDICKDVGSQLNVEYEQNACDLIAELVWKNLLMYGQDLELFSK